MRNGDVGGGEGEVTYCLRHCVNRLQFSRMQITLETGVPVPSRRHGRNHSLPFDQLEVGGSFFVPLSIKSTGTVQVATHRANQNADGKEFQSSGKQTKEVTGDGHEITLVAGTRVWRVK